MKKLMYAVILLLGLSMTTISCKKENSKEFVGNYTANEIKLDAKIKTSSSEIVDLPVVSLKNVSLELKEGSKKNIVTGELSLGSYGAKGNVYHIEGECSGKEVVFDDVTINLNDIHTASGDVSLNLVLSCVGTLMSETLILSISYGGTGSITQNGATKSGNIVEGVVNNVNLTKQGSSSNYSSLIVGKWKCIQTSKDGINWEEESFIIGVEFCSDGTWFAIGIGSRYKIEGNKLTMTFVDWMEEKDEYFIIISLTNSELVLYDESDNHYEKYIRY